MSKPVLSQVKMEDRHRSGLESKIAEQLDRAGIEYDYEGEIVAYKVPARDAKYKADFPIRRTPIIIEGKGHFGGSALGRFSNMKDTSAKQRQKFALLKEQHPELDIRFVFTRASAPIYKGSKTTHAKWCDDHNFLWSDKGVVPQKWIEEIKSSQAASGPKQQSPLTVVGCGVKASEKMATAKYASKAKRSVHTGRLGS